MNNGKEKGETNSVAARVFLLAGIAVLFLACIALSGCVQQPPQQPLQQPSPAFEQPAPVESVEPSTAVAPAPTVKTDLYGSMLAFNVNDAGASANGLQLLQQNGWSEFRKDAGSYQKLKNGLKTVLSERAKLAKQTGFSVDREIAAFFTWNVVEPEKGTFDWELTDLLVEAASGAGVKLSGVIQPFASWDQKNTAANPGCNALDFAYYDYKAGPPQDLKEYQVFLTKLVERYKNTVAFWEIGNEVEGDCGGFKDNPQGYLDLLKISYQTIKKADARAIVLNGGALEISGRMESAAIKEFWQK
ncbi:MAG: hypothetical protein V1834_04560, partial [Candidatus Micrarchaeota archaeon]